jgi:hypothetical protein
MSPSTDASRSPTPAGRPQERLTTIENGTPILTKSPKAYCPGPTTRVFTGDEIGVMKAVDAASAMVIANG